MKSHWLAALALLAWGALSPETATAEIFKCRDASGAVIFSDLPCGNDAQDEGPAPIDSTPKSLGVDCFFRKNQAACGKLQIVSDGKPEVLAKAQQDARYATDRESCLAGDEQACKRSICSKAFSDQKTAADILACSREQRLPNGGNWAMVLPWQEAVNGMRKGQAMCLNNFAMVEIRDNPNAAALSKHQPRYAVANQPAATLEEGASRACSR